MILYLGEKGHVGGLGGTEILYLKRIECFGDESLGIEERSSLSVDI